MNTPNRAIVGRDEFFNETSDDEFGNCQIIILKDRVGMNLSLETNDTNNK